MRIELRIDECHDLDDKKFPVLITLIFTKVEEYYLHGGTDGIYNCACTIPEDKRDLISIIQQSINACLETMDEDDLK